MLLRVLLYFVFAVRQRGMVAPVRDCRRVACAGDWMQLLASSYLYETSQ